MYIWNEGRMPTNLSSTEKLFMKHSSKPFNPKLADIFFRSGMIEAWGRGFDKIKEACTIYGIHFQNTKWMVRASWYCVK